MNYAFHTEHSDLTGVTIGEYRLDRKLGHGGMGAVYLASHRVVGHQVALKVLFSHLAHDPDISQRFIREARIQIGLEHPNLVKVYTVITGSYLALVMEYVEGASLSRVLERRGRLSLEEVLKIFGQVAQALNHAHEHKVIHRDIKPDNIMIQGNGTAKIMDFGIAQVQGEARLTRTNMGGMGTLLYMAPEQMLGRRDMDHRVDIYSLAVTVYEALCGRPPFIHSGDSESSCLYYYQKAHIEETPPDPRVFDPSIPEHVALALLKGLGKDPDHRYEDCLQFHQALQGVYRVSLPTRPAQPVLPSPHVTSPAPDPFQESEEFDDEPWESDSRPWGVPDPSKVTVIEDDVAVCRDCGGMVWKISKPTYTLGEQILFIIVGIVLILSGVGIPIVILMAIFLNGRTKSTECKDCGTPYKSPARRVGCVVAFLLVALVVYLFFQNFVYY